MTNTPRVSALPGRISRAAVALFARQGYHGTSTREIARLADVSEVTLFRYFVCKEDVFVSALESSFSTIKPRLSLFDRALERSTPEAMLPQILSLLVDLVTFSPELMRLVAVAFLEIHGKAEDLCSQQLAPLLTAIAGYLTTNMENGKLRNLNPSIVTAAMALTVMMQPEVSKLLANSGLSQMTGREAIDEYSKFWMRILIPAPLEMAQCSPSQAQALSA